MLHSNLLLTIQFQPCLLSSLSLLPKLLGDENHGLLLETSSHEPSGLFTTFRKLETAMSTKEKFLLSLFLDYRYICIDTQLLKN